MKDKPDDKSDLTAIHPSRRSFLKASGIAAIGSTLVRESDAAPASEPAADPTQVAVEAGANGLVDWVNVLQGTASTEEFSRGNTLPIAAVPFGMNHWTLQSQADTPWMFQPGVRRTQGFRCTHQISPWLDDYGHAIFLPFRGEIHGDASQRASSYRPEDADLRPYSLQLFLLRYRAHVELVPTERGCVISASFDKTEQTEAPGLLIDIPGASGAIEPDPENKRIRFTSTANAGGVPKNFATYYVLSFPEKWQSFKIEQVGQHRVARVYFSAGQNVEVRMATSFISFEQAAINLERELGNKPIDELRAAAAHQWNDALQRIEIEGASTDQQRTFYSCFYRALLFPPHLVRTGCE